MTDESRNGTSSRGSGPDEIQQLLEAIHRTLQTELSVKNFHTEVLTQLLRQQSIIACWIETISKQTCASLNEAHYQTELQRSIRDSVGALLEIGKLANPAAALELERIREVYRRLEECCPPDKPAPICEPASCIPSSPSSHGSADSSTVRVKTRSVEGAQFPPIKINLEEGEGGNEDRVPAVPIGPLRGSFAPTVRASQLLELSSDPEEARGRGGAGSPVIFDKNSPFGTVVSFSGTPPDMSGAMSDRVVFLTGNTFAALSTDAGATFTALDPTTIFPSGPTKDAAGNFLDNGLCCDQVVQYAPQIDRFIWLMQFCGAAAATGGNCLGGTNRLRIAYASPDAIVNSGGTAWTYFDIASATVNVGNMDYPDLSIGTDFLYGSVDAVGTGLLVFRVPLAQLQSGAGNVDIGFTNPSDSATAYGGHISQNTADEVFWAGHFSTSKLRVFNWPQSSGQYSWRDIDVESWPSTDYTSTCPDKTDWLNFMSGFPGNAVIGATRRFAGGLFGGPASEVYFAWTAGRGGGFAHPHVRIAQVDTSNYSVKEWQIWNPDHAFAYPCLATNSSQEIGISLGWGGGDKFFASHAVGILNDFVVWYAELSDAAINRWGDYVSVRRANPKTTLFAAVGYSVMKNPAPAAGSRFNPRYILFGRESEFKEGPIIH
jgi:hypothetical protein